MSTTDTDCIAEAGPPTEPGAYWLLMRWDAMEADDDGDDGCPERTEWLLAQVFAADGHHPLPELVAWDQSGTFTAPDWGARVLRWIALPGPTTPFATWKAGPPPVRARAWVSFQSGETSPVRLPRQNYEPRNSDPIEWHLEVPRPPNIGPAIWVREPI